jgi:hypothetical protein
MYSAQARSGTHHGQENKSPSKAEYITADLSISEAFDESIGDLAQLRNQGIDHDKRVSGICLIGFSSCN